MLGTLLFCVIELLGVQGNALRARAFFDANNVKVGDPLILTIDFIGDADFHALHPPALSKAVDRADWKVDDASAKTDTFQDARRLTYRVRPRRVGLLRFPSLSFSYRAVDGTMRLVRANEIPVHAKAGVDVVVAGMEEATDRLPAPPALVTDPGVALSDDMRFSWKRVCANPTADAFAAFDFPAARLNEASCAIREGNWARAERIYTRLEWQTGQTDAIERGMVAALALRFDNPSAELPVARQVFRPLLRLDWKGRVGTVLGGILLLSALFWALGRGIRALACLAGVLLVFLPARADLFEQMEEQMRRMRQQMSQSMRVSLGGAFEKEERAPVRIAASLATDKDDLRVGEPFAFIVSLEAPRNVSIGQISMVPSERFGLTVTGRAENLPDQPAANPSNVIKRLSVPVRYDVPFKGNLSFTIQGMASGRETRRGGGFFSFTFSNSFSCETSSMALEVKALATDGQPSDFAGIVSEGLHLRETCDILRVETNDVVTISYRLIPKGYVPADYVLPGSAFEWARQTDREGRVTEIEYRRFFVADGAAETPKVSVPYYDPRTKSYTRAEAGGARLLYTDGTR